MGTQLPSSSYSLDFVWRLHFSLRLPDTLDKGSNRCLPGLSSMTWQVTSSFSSHSPHRWSQPNSNGCTRTLWAASVLLVWLTSVAFGFVLHEAGFDHIHIVPADLSGERREFQQKTRRKTTIIQRANLGLFLPFRPFSPHLTLNHRYTGSSEISQGQSPSFWDREVSQYFLTF